MLFFLFLDFFYRDSSDDQVDLTYLRERQFKKQVEMIDRKGEEVLKDKEDVTSEDDASSKYSYSLVHNYQSNIVHIV